MSNRTTVRTRRRPGWAGAAVLAVLIGLPLACLSAGCTGMNMDMGMGMGMDHGSPKPIAPVAPRSIVPSYDDTIGYYGDVPVDQYVLLRGYGLVVLPKPTGSRECPPGIRRIIQGQLSRLRIGESGTLFPGLKIDEWISSMDTAAVEVRGLMPAGAIKDEMFDVLVTALPGSQTTSLEGGVLAVTDMSIWRRGHSGGMIHGKALAVASGPVFLNPFPEKPRSPESPVDGPMITALSQPDRDSSARPTSPAPAPVGTPVDLRKGWIMAGATVLKDQPLSLVLHEPNYNRAHIAQEQLTTLFPSPAALHGCAHAAAPNLIELTVPGEYRNQVNFWLAMVRQTFLRREAGFLERRMASLAQELSMPDTPDGQRLRAAVTFVAIGRTVLPVLQPLYSNENQAVAFYSAYAGLRIGDNLALRVLLEIIRDPKHPYRLQAVQALGQPHRFVNISTHLAPLLDEDNAELRIAAYRSISKLDALAIDSYHVGPKLPPQADEPEERRAYETMGFRLDVVRCQGPPLIYIARSGKPRVVLFGGDTMRIAGPVFLHSERTGLTLSVGVGEKKVTLMRTNPASGRLMPIKIVEEKVLGPDGKQLLDPGTKLPMTKLAAVTDVLTPLLLADVIRKIGGEPLPDRDSGELTGLGLNYSQVVHVLYQLSQANAVPSRVYLEQIRQINAELSNETTTLAGTENITSSPEDRPAPQLSPDAAVAGQPGVSSSQPAGDDSPYRMEAPSGGRPGIGN